MADQKDFLADGFFDWQLSAEAGKTVDYSYDRERYWGGFAPYCEGEAVSIPSWAIHGIEKYADNPIFDPDLKGWDSGHYGGVHNSAVIKKDGYFWYLYRGEFRTPNDPRLAAQLATGIDYHCDIGLARCTDGIHFERVAGPFFRDDEHVIYSYEDVCLVQHEGKYYAYFNQWDWVTFRDPSRCGVCMAVSDDLFHWEFKGLLFLEATRIHRNACVLQNLNNEAVRDKQGRFVMYLNNGLVAYSEDLIHWTSTEMKKRFPGGEGCFALAQYDERHPDAVILFTGGHHSGHFYAVGEVLFDLADCSTPIECLKRPVLTADPDIPWEDGKLKDAPYQRCSHFKFFTGMTQVGDKIYMYYGGSEYYTCLCTADMKSDSIIQKRAMIIAIFARFNCFENKYQKQFLKYQRNINFDIDKYQSLCYNINMGVIDMVEFEKIIYDLVAKVSVLETKVSLLQDRVAELEGNNVTQDTVTEAKTDGRDKTRYSLDGVTYLKNRFVWAVVNKYIQEHQNITYDELIAVFGDKNQGCFGVVRRVDSEIVKKNPIRYFCKKDDDILAVADGEIVVSNQWSKTTVTNIFDIAVQLGYSVKKI